MFHFAILCLLLVIPIDCYPYNCQNLCNQYQPFCGSYYNCGGCCNPYRPYPMYPGQFIPIPNYPFYPQINPGIIRPTIIGKPTVYPVKPTPKPTGPVTVVVDTSSTIKEWICPVDKSEFEDGGYKSMSELPTECESDDQCSKFPIVQKCCYHFGLDTHICKPAVTA